MIQFELPAKSLAQCLRSVSAASGERSPIPILSNVLLCVSGGRMRAYATNLDQWLLSEVDCAGDGELTVGASELESIAATLDGATPIKAKANGSGIMELAQGRAKFKLPTLPVEDFPSVEVGAVLHKWTFPSASLIGKLRALEPAAEVPNSARYYLAGIFFDLQAGKLVATNGHVLGATNLDGLAVESETNNSFIFPRVALSAVYSLSKLADTIELSLHDCGKVQMVAGAATFRTKLVQGSYPDYQRVIPRDSKTQGSIHCADLIRAIDCVLANTAEVNKSRALSVTFGREQITVSSRDSDGREAFDACEWDMRAGDEVTAGFNGPYLRWATSSLGESATLHLEINDAWAALAVTADGDRSAVRVVMPRRL